MKNFFVILGLFGGAVGPVSGQSVSAIRVAPVAGRLPGTVTVNLQGVIPPAGEQVMEDSVDLMSWNRVSPVLKPVNGLLDWSLVSGPIFQGGGITYPAIRFGNNHTLFTGRFYRLRTLTPAEAAPVPIPVVPQGRLLPANAEGSFTLTTRAGWRISIAPGSTIITSPDLQGRWEFWGEGAGRGHENLNGKHIKDWETRRRTILLPGDTMITMVSAEKVPGSGEFFLRTMSLYDGDQTHRLNRHNHTVEMSVLRTRVGEAAEADGETMRLWPVGGGRYFAENLYLEETAGAPPAPQEAKPLGDTGGEANPHQVNDYYDDPRLAAT